MANWIALGGEGAVDALDAFVDFVAVLEADDDGMNFRTGHGEADGFFAVFGLGETRRCQ